MSLAERLAGFNILCGSKFTEALCLYFAPEIQPGFNILCGSKFTEARQKPMK